MDTFKSEKALVVFSGGQDSTTCLYWALEHFSQVHTITFGYGQKHSLEIECAKEIANRAGVDFRYMDTPPSFLCSPLLLGSPGYNHLRGLLLNNITLSSSFRTLAGCVNSAVRAWQSRFQMKGNIQLC